MPSSERWLLRDVLVDGAPVDCRIRDGVVAEVGRGLDSADGETLVDGKGGALTVGLADHHLHLHAAAAARRSVDLAGGTLPESMDDSSGDWLRVVGAGVELTRHDLDAAWPNRPVRVQHRSGALWTLNTAALDALAPGATGEELATGQFWRAGPHLRRLLPVENPADLAPLAADLASFGITHVTDATPDLDARTVQIPQHLLSLSETGDGPRKLVIADHELPDLDALTQAVGEAHADGRGVALHVVSAVAMAVAIAILTAAGTGGFDRIEHAAVCNDDAARRLADLGVTVVTQPSIPARHGSAFLADSDPDERPLLWRYGGLLRAGLGVAVSSDAPYGSIDPWQTIRAAATRAWTDAADEVEERVGPGIVFASMTTSPLDPAGAVRRVEPGANADLALFDADLPVLLDRAIAGRATHARATFIAGDLVHSTDLEVTN